MIAFTIRVLVLHGFSLFRFAGIPAAGRHTLRGRDSVDDFVYEVLLSQASDTGNT